LPKEQAEAADRKSYTDQAKSRANPGKEGSLGSEIYPRILLSTLIHSPIVLNIRVEFDVVILEPAHQTLHVIFRLRRSANRRSAIRIALAMIVSEGLTALAETKQEASTT
jgi:hypothetical protein